MVPMLQRGNQNRTLQRPPKRQPFLPLACEYRGTTATDMRENTRVCQSSHYTNGVTLVILVKKEELQCQCQ